MKARIGRTIDELSVGDTAYFAKTLSEADMLQFAGITGDVNQLPINEEFARRSRYGRRVAHGMLTASLITNIIGMHLPGYGATMESQGVRFLKPVFIGDTVEIGLTITGIRIDEHRVDYEAVGTNQRGESVMQAHGVIIPPQPLD